MIADSQIAKAEKFSWLRSTALPVLVLILLVLALPYAVMWRPAFSKFSHSKAYRMSNGFWHPLPELPGEPRALRTSAKGTVWVSFLRGKAGYEFARLDAASWRAFTSSELGLPKFEPVYAFELDGEDLWAATGAGALHWDGSRWTVYREVRGSSIVAAAGQVWAINESGILSHFDGREWKSQKTVLPGVNWDKKAEDDDQDAPQLARTNDGSLWIVRDGVWCSDTLAANWVRVKSQDEDYASGVLVGATSQQIWLWNVDHLDALKSQNRWEEFDGQEIGLGKYEWVNSVTEAEGRWSFATRAGVVVLEGGKWRRLPPPAKNVNSLTSIGSARGELFAIGTTFNPWASRWRIWSSYIPLLMTLAILAVVVWIVKRHKRSRLNEHVRMQHAVTHATGEVPDEFVRDEQRLARQSTWWSATLAVLVVIGAIMGYQAARMVWPRTPSWVFLVIAAGLHIVVTVLQSVVRKTPKPWDPIEPGGPRFEWGATKGALPGSLAIFFLLNAGELPKWLGDPALIALVVLWAVFSYKFVEQKLLHAASRRGDYESGMRIIRRFRFYNPDSGAAMFRRGHMLVLAGRFREAELALRGAVAKLGTKKQQGYALEFLGDALLEQGRYDEAMRSYEAALRAVEGFRRPYRGMAEVMLRRDRNAAQALEYIEKILPPKLSRLNPASMNTRADDDYWSLRAWALAELGRRSEVDAAVAKAIEVTNPKSHPDVATIYRRLGLAMQALERESEAEEYLKKALEADPAGKWSAAVKGALGRRGVFRG